MRRPSARASPPYVATEERRTEERRERTPIENARGERHEAEGGQAPSERRAIEHAVHDERNAETRAQATARRAGHETWEGHGVGPAMPSKTAMSRASTSAAVDASSTLPVSRSIAPASTTPTVVRPAERRTMTLHGRSSPTSGSASSACFAASGLQAPKMTYWPMSAPSLARSVAATSISDRTPKQIGRAHV